MAKNNVGQVTQVLGAVVDVQFEGELPYMLYRIAPASSDSAPLGKKVAQQPR